MRLTEETSPPRLPTVAQHGAAPRRERAFMLLALEPSLGMRDAG